MQVESEFVQTSYAGTVQVYDLGSAATVTKYRRTAHVSHKYTVRNEMWHNVVFLLCGEEDGSDGAIATIEGEVAFRNPYGYIPAELFGILPFEVRAAARASYFMRPLLLSCYIAAGLTLPAVCAGGPDGGVRALLLLLPVPLRAEQGAVTVTATATHTCAT